MAKKISCVEEIKNGDIICLYGISNNLGIVAKKYFKINGDPTVITHSVTHTGLRFSALKVREDGSPIIDRWYGRAREGTICYYRDTDTFHSNLDVNCSAFYIDPTIPCNKVINKLKEEKRKINKKIVDCQKYMYSDGV